MHFYYTIYYRFCRYFAGFIWLEERLLIPIISKISDEVYWNWICAAVLSLGNVLFLIMRIKDVADHAADSVRNLVVSIVFMLLVLVVVLILI